MFSSGAKPNKKHRPILKSILWVAAVVSGQSVVCDKANDMVEDYSGCLRREYLDMSNVIESCRSRDSRWKTP